MDCYGGQCCTGWPDGNCLMANTVWSSSDKGANVVLSGGNLIATGGTPANQGVRSVDRQALGKFYVEHTMTTWAGAATCVGFITQTATLATNINFGTVFVLASGGVNCGGAQIASLGVRASGDVIGIAIDLTSRLIWFRVAPSGNWNGNASANPATGVGGGDISLSVGGVGIPLYPFAAFSTNGHSVTSNFGDTAFTGAVPSGYTSGFTAGASVPTNAIASQALAEHWLTTDPDARITQVSLEHWASVASGNLQAVVTFVALEHWTSVAVVVPAAGGPMVTMIH